MSEIKELTDLLVAFRDEREWSQFHDSKNLSLGLSIEAAELNELYLWKTNSEEIENVDKERLAEELADVLSYALLLAERNKLDPATIVRDKIQKNALKYPADKVKGCSKKYTEYK